MYQALQNRSIYSMSLTKHRCRCLCSCQEHYWPERNQLGKKSSWVSFSRLAFYSWAAEFAFIFIVNSTNFIWFPFLLPTVKHWVKFVTLSKQQYTILGTKLIPVLISPIWFSFMIILYLSIYLVMYVYI